MFGRLYHLPMNENKPNLQLHWDALDIVINGKSALDSEYYATYFESEADVVDFLAGYGFNLNDPIQAAELFGSFQEALDFIGRHFLKKSNPEGVDLEIPSSFFQITHIKELFFKTDDKNKNNSNEELWARTILKVMHIILHMDKDLRQRYFSEIQQQVFDRFYKKLHREEGRLYLQDDSGNKIELADFQTKARKNRESIIIKLLHKKENVAEELFDRIGIRFVTKNKVDILRVIDFLISNYIITVQNIKPSRSQNSLFDLDAIKKFVNSDELQEKDVDDFIEKSLENLAGGNAGNDYSSREYRAIHFTCRQLINYKNPLVEQIKKIRKMASAEKTDLSQEILNLDTSHITRDLRFFYPFEIQITDERSHIANSIGESSHEEYKKAQKKAAMERLFKPFFFPSENFQ